MFRKHKLVWFSVTIVVMMLASLGAGVVMAKSLLDPIDEEGVISGAYNQQSGGLRLVNGREDVKASEVFIWWNQQGDKAAEQEIKDGICVMCEALELVEEAPGFCFAIKQRQTLTIMSLIIFQNELYYMQHYEEYAPSLEVLVEEKYLAPEMVYDGWGNQFVYHIDEQLWHYTLTSLGYDGEEGPDPPDPWYFGESGESDIIIGHLVYQVPE